MNVPPLVTASPAGTPRDLAGVIGALGTRGSVRLATRSMTTCRPASVYVPECGSITARSAGLKAATFSWARIPPIKSFGPENAPVVARPFIDVNPGVSNPFGAGAVGAGNPNSELVVFPGVVNGFIGVHTSTDLYGFDANFRKNLICSCDYRVDGLVGYRYLNLQDDVTITENLTVLSAANPAIPQGTTFALQDRFRTINDFNGGQIGLAGETWSGRWYLSGRNLIALGNTHTETTISGVTVATTPGGTPIVNAGGLLTQPTNIGTYNNDKFSVVYEAQTSLGYQVTDGIRAFVSYSFLYWTDVARAGDQIDFVVNSSQIPPGALDGAARPVFVRNETNFWAQGISFGLEMRY